MSRGIKKRMRFLTDAQLYGIRSLTIKEWDMVTLVTTYNGGRKLGTSALSVFKEMRLVKRWNPFRSMGAG
jgi:hypothetical protein